MNSKLLNSILLAGTLLSMSGCSFRVIDSGERGVKTTFGKVESESLKPGLNWKWPFLQGITLYDIRVQKRQERTKLFSSDVQETTVDYALNYSLDPERVSEIYKRYGSKEQLETVLLEPAIFAALKDTMGKYKAEEMISKREQAAKEILDRMRRDMTKDNEPVIIKDFTLVDIDFSNKFENAVEEKVVAAQKALTEQNVVEQLKAKKQQQIVAAESEAEQVKIKAQAEAEKIQIQAKAEADRVAVLATAEAKAIEMRGQAISKNPQVLQLEAITKWTGAVPNFVSGEGGKIVPILDITALQQKDAGYQR